jgi:regulator of RNase E activity RraA
VTSNSLASVSIGDVVLARLGQYTTATISDAQKSFGIMRPTIRPLAAGMRIVGTAYR